MKAGNTWRGSFLWIAVALLLAMVLFIVLQRAEQGAYNRFVSAPMPDGTRYTFRYPAYLPDVQESKLGVNIYQRTQSLSTWDDFRRRVGVAVFRNRGESVTVVLAPLPKKRIQEGRSDERWERMGHIRHNVSIVDACIRTRFYLFHDCPVEAREQFRRSDRIITQSFQVLPPGVRPAAP